MSKERAHGVDASELAQGTLKERRNRISSWLMGRGLGVAAIGSLSAAGYLALFGGTIVSTFTAPLFVAAAGATAAVGFSLAAAGVGKRAIDSMRG